MTPPRDPSPRPNHDACHELLPWLVNDTLDDAERAGVEAHLEVCERCARERAELESVAAIVREDARNETAGDLETVRARTSRERPLPHAAARSLRWAVAAQAAVIVALLAAFLWPAAQAELPAFRTLSDPAAVAPVAPALRVVFDPDASVGEVTELLAAAGAEIVSGPNRAGAFAVRPSDPGARLSELAERLGAEPRVRLVERAVGPTR
ncbi:MAG: zf-HC2 domain-containing protein [Thermoanaerobaculia bacterium]|nr:zf-HC2 domain-containing protein [Thermoanaerobaculia bacterium]